MTPQELLDDAGIRLGSYAPGQHSATIGSFVGS